jgi:hypothetical protein
MPLPDHHSSVCLQGLKASLFGLTLSLCACVASAESAYERVNQVGYEAAALPARI